MIIRVSITCSRLYIFTYQHSQYMFRTTLSTILQIILFGLFNLLESLSLIISTSSLVRYTQTPYDVRHTLPGLGWHKMRRGCEYYHTICAWNCHLEMKVDVHKLDIHMQPFFRRRKTRYTRRCCLQPNFVLKANANDIRLYGTLTSYQKW